MPEDNSGRLAAKANQLYWQTSRPAGHLADELGISRSKFYALIEPLRVKVKCPACGAALAFSSRSDREAGRGRCPECGATADIPAAEMPAVPALTAEPPSVKPASDTGIGAWMELPGSRKLWLTAITGVAVGILMTGLFRRR
ncbi:MAG: hypothetical protein V3U13_07655 [Gemmatimonadota bacterium]